MSTIFPPKDSNFEEKKTIYLENRKNFEKYIELYENLLNGDKKQNG